MTTPTVPREEGATIKLSTPDGFELFSELASAIHVGCVCRRCAVLLNIRRQLREQGFYD
jgi:hypothetical protein